VAKERMVDTSFWDDSYIISLDPIEKLLFIYFLTNPLTNIAGVYEITLKRVAFDTGIDRDTVLKILDRFEEAGKIYYRDGYVIIKNFIKRQAITEKSKIKKGIEIILNGLPKNIKIYLEGLLIPYTYPLNYSNSNSNTNTNSNSNTIDDAETYETFFSNNLYPITPIICDMFDEYQDLMGDAVVKEAITEAIRNGARSPKYIETILRDWKAQGIKDMAGVEAMRKERATPKRRHDDGDKTLEAYYGKADEL
jgi:DnaD/phage-associated family protein